MRVCPKCRLEYRDNSTRCADDGTTLDEAPDPCIGKLFGGRYRIERVLGEGGMATVYAARHTLIERPVAVKVLHKHLAHDATLRERFVREARSAATIAHENVIEIYDLGEIDDGRPYIVMELLSGEPLRDVVNRGAMDAALVCELGAQMARGLARAHDLGIVHRDLKPENVFITKNDDGTWLAKVVDFGIAQSKKDARITALGTLVGTPEYLSPERIRGRESGPSSDLYSFGVLLFEMITGRVPFLSDDLPGFLIQHMEASPPAPTTLAPSCPPVLEMLILDLLAKTPEKRPVDMHQVVRVLEAQLHELSIAPSPPPPAPKAGSEPEANTPATTTLERVERRLLVLRQLLQKAFPTGGLPQAVAEPAAVLDETVTRMAELRKLRLAAQARIDSLDSDTKGTREQLGRAVHTLGVDLSNVREELRAAEDLVRVKTTELHDLDFQLGALREKLQEVEQQTTVLRAEADTLLLESGQELHALEVSLDHGWQSLYGALNAQSSTAQLLSALKDEA